MHQRLALDASARLVLDNEARTRVTDDLLNAAHVAGVLISACLSADGQRFDVRVRLDPAAPLAGDAECSFRDDGAEITVARVPQGIYNASETSRAVALVVIAAEAFVAQKAVRDGFEWTGVETASHALVRAALSAAPADIAVARRRLCH